MAGRAENSFSFYPLTKVPARKTTDSFCSIWTSLNFRGGLNALGVPDRVPGANGFPIFEGLPGLRAVRREGNLNGRVNQETNKRSYTVR